MFATKFSKGYANAMSKADQIQPLPFYQANSTDVLGDIEQEMQIQHLPAQIVAQLRERVALGEKKYGMRLVSFNGRNAGQDCLQEALDGIMYSQQMKLEGHPLADKLRALFVEAVNLINEN